MFPTYGEAHDAVWRNPDMLFRIVPKELIAKTNESELILYLKNGSMIQLKGSDNPDALRGPNPLGIIFDEWDTQKKEAWEYSEPIIRGNGGWAWFIGTPKGKKNLYPLYLRGQGENREWKSWLLKASTSGIIPPDQLVESKLSMPQATYNQEWECEFLEGEGAVFRNVKDICTAQAENPIKDHRYVMGVDLAKYQDYTVIAIYDRASNKQVFQARFNKLDWPFQQQKIEAYAKYYNNAVAAVDATGLGDPIVDALSRRGVRVEAIKITETLKKELIEKLSIWIETRKIQMLYLPETLEEFENFSYEIGPTGKVRYGAPEGRDLHDDIVIAHALAIHLLNPLYVSDIIIEKPLIRTIYEKRKKEYEQEKNEYTIEDFTDNMY